MSIYRKIKAVERVFSQLEQEIKTFQTNTHLGCLSQCGLCCTKPDIEASVIEFLPFAYNAYKAGIAWEWYEKLRDHENQKLCIFFKPFMVTGDKGFCSAYGHRGMICRLFGFAASRNKYGNKQLSTCKPIKEHYGQTVLKVKQDIEAGLAIPIMQEYYHKLLAIDLYLANKFLPINQAIMEALKEVMAYYSYRTRTGKKVS